MTKKAFLDSLAKKLAVLEESERQDILSEYTDTINEKVKQGQSEEDAVKDFGDIDDLVKEILKAYKINPDFDEKEESFTQKSEELIKQGAGKIADFSRNLADKFKRNNNEINLEFIFEIIIKIFVVLVAALILKGVFELFSGLGESLFGSTFEPAASLLSGVWNLLLLIIYIIICVLIVIAMFKKYFSSDDSKEVIRENIDSESSKDDKNNERVKTVKKTPKQKKNNGTSLGEICLLIVKILVIIYVIIPFIIFDALSVFGLIVSIVYFIKGINLLGAIIFLAGLVLLFTYLIKMLISLLFGKGKASIIPFIVSIIMMVTGGILFADMVMNIDYIDKAPTTVKRDTKEQTFNTDKDVLIEYGHYGETLKTVDNSMVDGQFTIKVTYSQKYQNLEFSENDIIDCANYYEDVTNDTGECIEKTYHLVNVMFNDINDFDETKYVYHEFIENLKDNKVYNYGAIYNVKIEIIANAKTLDKIKMI